MKTIFLDRDGVINRNLHNNYVKKWDEFEFLPKAKEAIKTLTDANWNIIVISNQAGIGKGVMSAQTVEEINARMIEHIEDHGGKVEAVYYCPHRPDEGCKCRKPQPGLLLRAIREFGIELSGTYLIDDKITDIQAGKRVGCATILVKTGCGEECIERRNQWPIAPDYIVSDLNEAVVFLLALGSI